MVQNSRFRRRCSSFCRAYEKCGQIPIAVELWSSPTNFVERLLVVLSFLFASLPLLLASMLVVVAIAVFIGTV
jgi:hypothetical protein